MDRAKDERLVEPTAREDAVSSVRTYRLDAIPAIELIYAAIESRTVPEITNETNFVNAAILPHHTILGEQLADFWWELKRSNSEPNVIVLVGPTHEDQGDHIFQTTQGNWETPFGTVSTSTFAQKLDNHPLIATEPNSFINEHSIGAHMPFIARLYPETPVVPVLIRQTARDRDVQELVQELSKLDENVLFIASIDFSHYLSQADTEYRDEIMEGLIKEKAYGVIENLNSDYVDSPGSLIAYLRWGEKMGCEHRQRWHGNNYDLFDAIPNQGTSYFVYYCGLEAPVKITAAGDVMLGRGVEYWLSRTTIPEAFDDAKELFSGSDIGFVNLESVMTTVEPSTGKEIFFKGRPENLEVLNFIGVTHVSVANNHVDDYGRAGWADSVEHIRAAGIEPVGGYRNDGEVIFSSPFSRRTGSRFAGEGEVGRGSAPVIAFIAHDDTIFRLDETVLAEEVADAAEMSDMVIVSFHWGVEYAHTPTSRQIALAHAAVDAGADIVIGHHPHVLQTIEQYGDAMIFYSLGNFVFDQIGFDENESIVAQIEWSQGLKSVELVPMRIKGGFPRLAAAAERQETLNRLAGWSDEELREQIKTGKIVW